MKIIYIAIAILILTSSCYKEVVVPESGKEVFELSLSPEMEEFVFNSRDSSYLLGDAELSLLFNEHRVFVKEMRVRGRTTLDYRRKSFSLKLDSPIFIRETEGGGMKKLTRFKLISLSMDYTYINNRIAFGILEKAGVMPLFYKYVTFMINGADQGVYFLIEDPEQYGTEQGSEFILRRDYHHGIEDAEYGPGLYFKTEEAYVSRFREMYTRLPELQGEALLEHLNERIDLTQYFSKMGVDYLLRNGDYTDEIYFYSSVEQDRIRYSIIPWDYDDIFSTVPHEVGRSWGPGTVFGSRSYDTRQDIFAEIGDKMVFSIEDDLDYAIAMDSLMYAQYERRLTNLLGSFGEEEIGLIFKEVESELSPFYRNPDVILQSQYDQRPSSMALWQENMAEKEALLKERLLLMKKQLNIPTK